MLPYRAPDEYDFVVEFTRLLGNEAVSQLAVEPGSRAAREDRGFELTVGAWGNKVSGFQLIGGKGPNDHPAGKKADKTLENGRRHVMTVQVRKDRVRSLLDGKVITDWPTNYSDITNPYASEMKAARQGAFVNRLGFRTWDNVVLFHRVYVVEMS